MKSTACMLALAAALLAGGTACKKSQPMQGKDRYGIGVDWPRLETDFRDNSEPNVQASVAAIKRAILYHQFPQAIAEMDRLSQNPTLSEPQKKLLGDLRAQTEQVMAKAK